MKKLLSTIHFGLSILVIIGVIIEFFFAGMGVFHAASFQIHRITGVILLAGSLLLLLISLIGRTGGKTIGWSVLLLVLLLIQPLLLQIHLPFVQAFHLVNGLLIIATCTRLVRFRAARVKGNA
jgi:Family of unknown function (DUF6220)